MRIICAINTFAADIYKDKDIMKLFGIAAIVAFLLQIAPVQTFAVNATDNDSVSADSTNGNRKLTFEGELYTEVNYGHKRFSENSKKWDFPHVIASGTLSLGSWSFVAELEYERFFEDGEWQDKFNDCFFKNKLYLNKRFSDAVQLKAGIIDVPVGVTNSGGPALTIYDPESEAVMLPLAWHEHGIALWGNCGRWAYYLSGLFYMKAPLKRSKALGVAARVDYTADMGLHVGLSGYKGIASAGMVCYSRPDFIGTNGFAYACLDFDYVKNGWTIDGSCVYSSDSNAMGYGIEAGFDLMSLISNAPKDLSVTPLARYDGFMADAATTMNKWTVGLNITPLRNLDLKLQYGSRHNCGKNIEASFDICLGYTLEI